MKRILLLVVAMLLATASFAQVKKSPAPERYGWDQEYPLYGQVKSVTISHYEYVSKFGKNEKGEMEDRQIYYFNEVGDVSEYEKEGEYSLHYKYDAGNVEIHKYNNYGALEICTANKCDENGRVLESAEYDRAGALQSMTFNEYDEAGNNIKSVEYNSAGNVSSLCCREYNEHDDLTSLKLYDSNESLLVSIEQSFTYDSASNITECLISSGSVNDYYVCNYDANGNLVVRECRKSLDDSLYLKEEFSYDERGENLVSIVAYEPRFDGRMMVPISITEYNILYVGDAPEKPAVNYITQMINVVKDTAIIEDEFGFADFTEEEIIVEEVEVEEEVVEEQVFVKVECMPSFAGGDLNTFRTWFGGEFKYPAIAAENGIQGRVVVRFVIEKDGRLTNIEFLQSPDPVFNEEVVRVLEKSPKWSPGYQQDRPVRVCYVFPIDVRLH